MEAQIKSRDNRILFKLSANTQTEMFEEIAKIQEVFDAATECGVCKSKEFRFQVRVVDDNKYYEFVCLNQECRARLAFGQHKKGGSIYVKRKDKEGKWIPNGGWVKWAGKQAAQEDQDDSGRW